MTMLMAMTVMMRTDDDDHGADHCDAYDDDEDHDDDYSDAGGWRVMVDGLRC